MNQLEKTIQLEEDLFPKNFSNYEEREFGICFYNTETPDSYDSNHAVIYQDRIKDLNSVLQQIREFYFTRNLQPIIYEASGEDGFILNNKDIFEKNGFHVWEEGPLEFMILQGPNEIKSKNRLRIQCLEEWDERIAEDIFLPSGEPWEIEVVKNSIKSSRHKVFVGYLGDSAVCIVYLHRSELGCCRFDYIVVTKAQRGKGFARELLSYVTDYCSANKFENCFQWPAHETSKRICYEAGFRVLFSTMTGRAAGIIQK